MRRWMVSCLRWVVTVVSVSCLIDASHFFHTPLLLDNMALLVEATLFLKTVRIRGTTVWVPKRRRWASMPHILHASSVFFIRRLLDGRLVLPLTQSLGGY